LQEKALQELRQKNMNQRYFIGFIAYLAIFLFSSAIPIVIFAKTRLQKEVCTLISLGLTVGLINLYFFIGAKMQLPSTAFLNEFHEIFWIIPPFFVYLSCFFIQRKNAK
jgi:hypothetical protein